MANGETKDHEARKQVAELRILHEACARAREDKEMTIENALEKNNRKVDALGRNMDEMKGGIKVLKGMMAVLMALVTVGALVVAIIGL